MHENVTTTFYPSYETREAAFRETVCSLIPRKHLGPRLFWEDFSSLSFDAVYSRSGYNHGFITSNPRDCLVFGTPRQVINASGMLAHAVLKRRPAAVESVLQKFGLQRQADQPVRTLSGGETVKLAIAKCQVEKGVHDRLCIASPYSWLSPANRPLFDLLFAAYGKNNIPVDLMGLDGENDDTPFEPAAFFDEGTHPLPFSLCLRNVRAILHTSVNPLMPEQTVVALDDYVGDLLSPALLTGENGHGKSLFAKVLSGALPYHGKAVLKRGAYSGRARLLFQDIVNQTLLRSFASLAISSAKEAVLSPQALYEDIHSFLRKEIPVECTPQEQKSNDAFPIPRMIDIKSMLASVRLATLPAALILDEPDWGLSKADTLHLLSAIVRTAHAIGVPVTIISHKSWWEKIAASILFIEKSDPAATDGFGLHLKRIR